MNERGLDFSKESTFYKFPTVITDSIIEEQKFAVINRTILHSNTNISSQYDKSHDVSANERGEIDPLDEVNSDEEKSEARSSIKVIRPLLIDIS